MKIKPTIKNHCEYYRVWSDIRGDYLPGEFFDLDETIMYVNDRREYFHTLRIIKHNYVSVDIVELYRTLPLFPHSKTLSDPLGLF